MKCNDCRFWREGQDHNGRCQRYAPRPVVALGNVAPDVWWPTLASSDGCGEGQPIRVNGPGLVWVVRVVSDSEECPSEYAAPFTVLGVFEDGEDAANAAYDHAGLYPEGLIVSLPDASRTGDNRLFRTTEGRTLTAIEADSEPWGLWYDVEEFEVKR